VDLVEQCAAVGELHHALEAGAFSLNDVHAELADVLVGRKVGRTSRDEVTVFDATGTALQDAAAAAAAFKKAMTGNYGAVFDFYYTAENGID
jgi:ornithine cyclodeaminase/alanine dehydrogenase-like protein (mu-crystallin family)